MANGSQPTASTTAAGPPPLLSRIGSVVSAWWGSASLVIKLYSVGVLTGLLAFAISWPWGPSPIGNGLLISGAAFLSGGFLIEAYGVAKKLWDTSLGKLGGLLVATMVGALAMAMAAQTINDGTGLDPSTVPYAVTFLAPLTAGYLILFSTFLLAMVCVALAALSLLLDVVHLAINGSWAKSDVEIEVLRLVGFLALILSVTALWDIGNKQYTTSLAGGAKWFVFSLEMYSKDDCALQGERVRRLNDELVAVGAVSAGTIHFSKRLCPIGKNAVPMPSSSAGPPS